jgi:GNAT superfamily N-acetyltransferase
MRAQEFITEGQEKKPVTIYTNPANKGATVDDSIKKSLPVQQISFDKLQQWENHKTMQDPRVADWVNNKLLPELQQNGTLDPLSVWNDNGELFVIDGNHRFVAYQQAGYRGRVPVQIVPDNMITIVDTVMSEQAMAENKAAGINKMFNNLGDPVYANLQRVALLAMQGRQSEAAGRLQTVIKHADSAVQKKITDAVNNIKPVTINGRVADSSTLDKSKQHNDWITNTFIPWVQSLLGKQGVAENFADGKNPVKFTVTTPDGYTHSFQITLAVHGKHVGHFNFVRSADTDDVNNEAEVESRWQGQGYGKLLLMKAIDVANNHGLDFQQDIRGITDAQQNVYDSLENAGLIVTPGDGFWFLTPQGEQELNGLNENFADGKNPGRKGLSKRVGVNTKASVSSLRKTAKNSSGEKQRMSHWLANMKAGRAKAKRK